MMSNHPENFLNVCRSCMLQPNDATMYNLFDENLADIFTDCTNVQVSHNDGLSSLLCQMCLEKLNNAYHFKKQCHKTNNLLKNYFSSLNDLIQNVKPTENDHKTLLNKPLPEINKTSKKSVSFTCSFCNSRFKSATGCKIHRTTHLKNKHKTNVQHANENDKLLQVKSQSLDGNNENEIDSRRKPICYLCGKSFTQASSLAIHMKRHKGDKRFICEFCPKAFVTFGGLEVHSYIHTGVRLFKCVECSKCFPTSDSLKKHKRCHSGEKSHLCSVCGKGFTAASTLHVHMRVHSGDKPLECPYCPMRFAAHAGLSVHVRKHTGERPYLCSNCGQSFKTSSDLTTHFRKHTGERPYACDLCDKKFRTSYMRLVHRRCHTGEKPAKCKTCQKCFTSNGHLKVHMMSHMAVKPFSCDVCKRGFTTSKDLNIHTMMHTGQKPHACTKCGKLFNRSNNLNKHMKLHLGLKPHACEICKSTFSTSTQLKIHVRSHTGERPYKCPQCKKSFTSSSGLTRHVRQQHKMKNTTDIMNHQENINNFDQDFQNVIIVENSQLLYAIESEQDILQSETIPHYALPSYGSLTRSVTLQSVMVEKNEQLKIFSLNKPEFLPEKKNDMECRETAVLISVDSPEFDESDK